MADYYILRPSRLKLKKYDVTAVKNGKIGRTISFGASGYTDYINENSPNREHHNIDPDEVKRRYLKRHHGENFGISGIKKAAFWARWIAWNQRTLKESIKDTEKRFNIKILYTE